jgi:arsenate reductase (glutaredoxin)
MAKLTIYHNQACGNSRGAMALLRERGLEFDVIEYLKNPPTRETLEKILTMLEGPLADLVRKDKRFGELGLNADDYTEPKKIVALLLQHPELMQRPIVIRGTRALIARPPEKLEALL